MRPFRANSNVQRHRISKPFSVTTDLLDDPILADAMPRSASNSSLQYLPHELQVMVFVYALEDVVDAALEVARQVRVSATHPFFSLSTRINDLALLSMSSCGSTVAALRIVVKRQNQICGALEARRAELSLLMVRVWERRKRLSQLEQNGMLALVELTNRELLDDAYTTVAKELKVDLPSSSSHNTTREEPSSQVWLEDKRLVLELDLRWSLIRALNEDLVTLARVDNALAYGRSLHAEYMRTSDRENFSSKITQPDAH